MKYVYSSSKEFQKEILEHPELPWDWNILSFHHLITTDFIEGILLTIPSKEFNWNLMSQNPNITFPFVLTYLDKPWNWMAISEKNFLTFQFIEEHLYLP
jgi:hypothetical protein